MSVGHITSLADIVRTHGLGRPQHPALIEDTRVVSWAGLYENAQRVANGFAAAGVGAQDRVAFIDKNSIEHFEVLLGASLLNAVCVDVNWRLAPPEMEYIVNNAEAKVLVVGPDFAETLDKFAANLTTVKLILVVGGHGGYEDWSTWMARQSLGDPHVSSAPNDVAFQLYSSGTTGLPKGVMLSNNNFLALVEAMKDEWKLSSESVNLAAMPLFHIGGGGWAMAGMYYGCTTVVLRDMNPATLGSLIETRKVTHGFVVPAVLQFMTSTPGIEKTDFSSLHTIVYGAAPISEEVLARSVRLLKCNFWQAYGLTETTGAVINLPPADHDPDGPNKHRLRSCGLPGPGVEVKIVDSETDKEVPVGEVGEIWIRTAQNMLGYWKRPEDTAKAITTDGWFKSGDAGYVDKDGYVYIHDRVKDMIVSGGENVYPAEVENALMSHPGIADVAVIGIPHDKWGETPLAVVVRNPDVSLTEQDVIAHAQERLAKFKCPTSVVWVDALPRNPSGKVLKKDLREPYWAGRERRVN